MRHHHITMLVLLCVTLASSLVCAEPTWIAYNDNAYALTEIGGTWTQCEAEALTHGAHLVAINDAEENQWLIDTFGADPYWIGLYRPGGPPDSPWVWSNGDPLVYINWYPSQPDVLHAHHDYVSISHFSSWTGLWGNAEDTGFPNGTPSVGIMEGPFVLPAPNTTWGSIKTLFF